MKNKLYIPLSIWIIFLSIQPACGGTAVSGDLPKYPGSVELKAGESAIGNTLAQNIKQDAALRQAMGSGGKTEQRGFTLPGDATWEQVKSFYDKELKASGWESGLGGVAGGFVDINAVMGAANQGNKLFHTAIWSKDKQTLTVVMVNSPTDKKQRELVLSLSTR